jgi:hypothetical protein
LAISSSTRKAGPFLGNDATTVFPFAFKVFTSADLRVVRTNALGVESDLVLDTDYTVTLNSNQDNDPGGTVTRATALPTGERLTITSDVEALQPLVLTNNGGFYPRVINDAFDKITIIAQQLIEQVGRSLKLPISSSASATLPDPVANRLIAWNSSANGFTNVDPTDLATVAAYADAYIDLFTGNGTQTAFTLTYDPAVLANLSVSISGVVQVGGEDFTWAGTTLTFLVAPPNGTRIQVRYTRAIPIIDVAAVELARDLAQGYASDAAGVSGVNVPSYASRASLAGATVAAAIKQIATRGYASEGDGGGWQSAARISYATIVSEGYPASSYQRSTDRTMPDGSTDATNGGYWAPLPNESGEINSRQLGAGLGLGTDHTRIEDAALLANILGCSLRVSGDLEISDAIDLTSIYGINIRGDGKNAGDSFNGGATRIIQTDNTKSIMKTWGPVVIDGLYLDYQTQPGNTDGGPIALELNNASKAVFSNIRLMKAHIGVGVPQAAAPGVAFNTIFDAVFINCDLNQCSHTFIDFRNYLGGGTNVKLIKTYFNGGGSLDHATVGQTCKYVIRGTNCSGFEVDASSIDGLTFTETAIELLNFTGAFPTLRFEAVRSTKNGGYWIDLQGGFCSIDMDSLILKACRSLSADGVNTSTLVRFNSAEYQGRIGSIYVYDDCQFTAGTRRIVAFGGASETCSFSNEHFYDPGTLFVGGGNVRHWIDLTAARHTPPVGRWNGKVLYERVLDAFNGTSAALAGLVVHTSSANAPGGASWAAGLALKTWAVGTRIRAIDIGDIGRIAEWTCVTAGVGGTWAPSAYAGDAGNATYGDEDATFDPITSRRTLRWNTTLTADRTLTLSAAPANTSGFRLRVTRQAAGAFTLALGATGKTLAAGQWADIEYDKLGAITVVAGGSIP